MSHFIKKLYTLSYLIPKMHLWWLWLFCLWLNLSEPIIAALSPTSSILHRKSHPPSSIAQVDLQPPKPIYSCFCDPKHKAVDLIPILALHSLLLRPALLQNTDFGSTLLCALSQVPLAPNLSCRSWNHSLDPDPWRRVAISVITNKQKNPIPPA